MIFDLKSIRTTSRKIGVRTDSSARFEKGVNVANAEIGIARALHLVSLLKCGKVVRGIIDIATKKNPERTVVGSIKKINSILGVEIPANEMAKILNNLGIKTKVYGDNLECIVPPYREDIENNNDLAEEIIRLYGYDVYDKIDYKLFENSKITEGQHHPRLIIERMFRNALVEHGFYENISYTLVPEDSDEKLLLNNKDRMVKISNPISDDLGYMRTSLAYSLLQNLNYNLSVGNKNIKIFECGRTYLATEKGKLPQEQNMLGICVNSQGYDFFNLKGVIEDLLNKTSLEYSLERSNEPYLHPGVSADVICGEKVVASFGKLHPVVAKNFDVPNETYYAQIDDDFLSKLPVKKIEVKTISKFPIVERDLAIVVDENVLAKELIDSIRSACGKLFYDVSLFDIYRSEALGENKKSMAFNIKLSSIDKTMTDEEINQVINKILKTLSYKHGAVLR